MPRGGASDKEANNYIAEWFGHRVFPTVTETPESLDDQHAERCPFLTRATSKSTSCVKRKNSKGVCTISSTSNGSRQDWLACPFRALDAPLLEDAVHRIFGYTADSDVSIVAASVLGAKYEVDKLRNRVASGKPTIVYFQNKLGGEISISATDRSPVFSFDATMIELQPNHEGSIAVGRYGIFEIQTMDFHGTYKKSVDLLRFARYAHEGEFRHAIEGHTNWLSDGVEGPNIANAFKRTFYQMMFKFQIGAHDTSAGCVLAIPLSVWESWQRHLGRPDLVEQADGTQRLVQLGAEAAENPPAWIYVFDINQSNTQTPNPLELVHVIGTDASALSHYALDVAPEAALEAGGSVDRLRDTITLRLSKYLPELRPVPQPRVRKRK